MDDSPTDFTQYAGNVVFPRSVAALGDTTVCPACQNVLTDVVCAVCGLDLTNPAASELATVSIEAAGLLNRRVGLIGRIRHESSKQAAAIAPAATTTTTPIDAQPIVAAVETPEEPSFVSLITTPTIPTPMPPFPAAAAPSPATTEPAGPRRSSVQITILVVAAALLSLAAIYFLIYAFITYGIGVRSAIIGAITVAAYVSASLIRRRGLTSTAEAIAAFAVVLTYLDVYAARANDLAGLRDADFSAYWGWAILASAVVFAVWGRFSAVRVPSITAFVLFPVAIGLLVDALPTAMDSDSQGFATLIAAAVAGLVHPLARRLRPPSSTSRSAIAERVSILLVSGFSLFIAAASSLLVYSESEFRWAIWLLVVAATAIAHLWVAVRTMDAPGEEPTALFRATTTVAALFTAIALSLLGAVLAAPMDNPSFALIAPIAGATVVLLVMDALRRRARASRLASPALVATIATLGIVILTAFHPFGVAMATTVRTLTSPLGLSVWGVSASRGEVAPPSPEAISAVVALAVALLLMSVYVRAMRTLGAAGIVLVWAAGLLLVLAVPLLGSVVGVTLGWLVLASAALAVVLVVRPGAPLSLRLRLPLLAVVALSLVLGYAISWARTESWWWASVVVVVLVMAGRRVVSAGSTGIRSTLLGIATVVALVGAGVLSSPWAGIFIDATARDAILTNAYRFTGILATVLFALAGLPRQSDPTNPAVLSFSNLDRRLTFWLTGITALGCLVGAEAATERTDTAGLIFAEPGTTIVLCLALLASLWVWIVPTAAERLRPERAAAALVVAPVTAAAFNTILMSTDITLDPLVTLTAAPSLLVAAVGLAVSIVRPHRVPRWALDLGAAVVVFPVISSTIINGITVGFPPGWQQLLLVSATVLLFSISRDGLFGSVSRRRHLGWLALALATGSLWAALYTAGAGFYLSEPIMPVEAYVLPLTGALLIIAALMWRAGQRALATGDAAATEPPVATTSLLGRVGAAPIVVFVALLISFIPISIAGASGSPSRAITIGAVATALMLVPLWVSTPAPARAFTFAVAVAGSIGVAVTVIARVIALYGENNGLNDGEADLWIVSGVVVFLAAAVGWSRLSTNARVILPSRNVVLLTVVGAVLLEVPGLNSTELGLTRVLTIVIGLAVVHVLGFALNRVPVDAVVAQTAIIVAAIVAVYGLTQGTIPRIEQVSVPLAVGLLGAGGIRLAHNSALRSWSTIGVGTAALLLPSLIATWTEPVVWRLVGLGVVAIAALVVGLVVRLQAPFILGAVVVLIHAIGTFSDEIRAVYENVPFWWWLAIGGLLLLLLGARYERRVQNFKSVVLKVGSLR